MCRVAPGITYHVYKPLPHMQNKADGRLVMAARFEDLCREVGIGNEDLKVFAVSSSKRNSQVLSAEEALGRVAIAVGLPCKIGSLDEFRDKILQIHLVIFCCGDTLHFKPGTLLCSCHTFAMLFTCSHVALVSTVLALQAMGGAAGLAKQDLCLPCVNWKGRPRKSGGPLKRADTDARAEKELKATQEQQAGRQERMPLPGTGLEDRGSGREAVERPLTSVSKSGLDDRGSGREAVERPLTSVSKSGEASVGSCARGEEREERIPLPGTGLDDRGSGREAVERPLTSVSKSGEASVGSCARGEEREERIPLPGTDSKSPQPPGKKKYPSRSPQKSASPLAGDSPAVRQRPKRNRLPPSRWKDFVKP
ncbi:hypothetical protein FOZ60_013267 [Perkinsus olseni]|uniref:SWIM-type domain-containing protein n=1 Tax=Perkinsus olseni TaxID=32597 RepID=A0A7J6N9Q8_PEROL|nr:hypothetical protein FOZ60_013267 [Perkinsus olseni]